MSLDGKGLGNYTLAIEYALQDEVFHRVAIFRVKKKSETESIWQSHEIKAKNTLINYLNFCVGIGWLALQQFPS